MVRLRLSRQGKKDNPCYKIIAIDSRKKCSSRFIEQIGTYRPLETGVNYDINLEKVDKWISNGAQSTETVASIIRKARNSNR